MSFLLDTNVISEWAKPQPDPRVIEWFSEVDEDRTFLSVASLAEIRCGIDLLPAGKRRDRLAAWLAADLPARFEGRILSIDSRTAELWGALMARTKRTGVTIGTFDASFAATATQHHLTLVTRNLKDFAGLGVPVFSPWEPLQPI